MSISWFFNYKIQSSPEDEGMSVLQQLWIISALLFSNYFKHTLLHFFEHKYLSITTKFYTYLDYFSTAAMLETSPQPCTAHSAMTSNSYQQTLTNDRTSTTTNKSTPNKAYQISKLLYQVLKQITQTQLPIQPVRSNMKALPINMAMSDKPNCRLHKLITNN